MLIDREKEPDKAMVDQEVQEAKSGFPQCPSCKLEVQSDASNCPHCGHDLTAA